MLLDLRTITFYVINDKDDYEKMAYQKDRLERLGLNYKMVPRVRCEPQWISLALSKLKILEHHSFDIPFAIIYDDVYFDHTLQYIYDLPENTDALYLGQSSENINPEEDLSAELEKNIHFEVYNEQYIRLLNNLGGFAVVYISPAFRQQAKDGILNALLDEDFAYNPEIFYTLLQNSQLVLSPINAPCYQLSSWGAEEETSKSSIYNLVKTNNFTDFLKPNQPNGFLVSEPKQPEFFLFFDIFVHWTQKKITAVAPYYGEDNPAVLELQKEIWLKVDDYLIKGKLIPCELDSWEPSVIIDFERPELEEILSSRKKIDIEIINEGKSQFYTIQTHNPKYEHIMSLIIHKRMRWLEHYLRYYIDIMKLDHVYFYLSHLSPDKIKELNRIVAPYVKRAKVTLIHWTYRWRNNIDKKQISQPPQQTHTLNKYGHGKWVGLFDFDEFLKLPGKSIPEFLAPYDPKDIGSVSFGLRWFFYKGPRSFGQVDNPLTQYIHAKEDPLGRKLQKLFASPKLARYARFHWVSKDLKEVPIDDTDIYFHHYYFHEHRFNAAKNDQGALNRSMANYYRGETTKQDLEDYVDLCLSKAAAGESRIKENVLKERGQIGTRALHYINNICTRRLERILYVGNYDEQVYMSILEKNMMFGTFVSKFDPNKVDKFTDEYRIRLRSNVFSLLNLDWDKIDRRLLDRYTYFIYNGPSDYPSTFKAYEVFHHSFQHYCILVINNWNQASTQKATYEAIAKFGGEIFFKRELLTDNGRNPHWRDGVAILGLDKALAK